MDSSFEYTTTATQVDNGTGIVSFLVYLGILALMFASMWKLFTKAGKPGWAAIVPIYNVIVLLEIVGRPIWWLVLLFVPFVNIVVAILLALDTAKVYGKGVGTALLLIFLPFIGYPLLAFGDASYVGPVADTSAPVQV